MSSNSLLVSVPSAAKKLGIPKKAVLSMIDTGVLVGIAAGGDTYKNTSINHRQDCFLRNSQLLCC